MGRSDVRLSNGLTSVFKPYGTGDRCYGKLTLLLLRQSSSGATKTLMVSQNTYVSLYRA